MQENFVGYVLNALDPDTHRQVEDFLRGHPEARLQVEQVRQALEPLEADAATIEPPPGLAVRTLAHIAEFCCRDVPRMAAPAPRRSEISYQRWWRRADVLVAASIFLCAALLIPPVINHVHRQYQLESCKNNMRQLGEALVLYSSQNQRKFPNVAELADKPRDVAGLVVPFLIDKGFLKRDDITVVCPGNGPPARCKWSLGDLQAAKMTDAKFQAEAPYLSCCYAYSLGYRNGPDKVVGCRQESFPVPLLADRPPFREGCCASDKNSPNHGGEGQNVLFTDGHVDFLTKNTFRGHNFYLNRDGKAAAGLDNDDIVLGLSEAVP